MNSTANSRRTVEQHLVDRATSLTFSALPRAAVAASKRSLMDTLAVSRAGAATAEDRAVRQLYLDGAERGESSYWSGREQLSAERAALVNGLDAAALDFDTVHHEAVIHPDIVTVPVVLALAERTRASGEQVLLAIAAGDDLSCRLSLASSRSTQWFDTSVHGVFGATLAGSLVLGLGYREIASALGLALCLASGTKQPIIEKRHAKRYQSALAARSAVSAVLLSAAGVGGVSEFFRGTAGYFSIYDAFDVDELMSDYGCRFENTAIGIKQYPNCLCNFAPITAALRARAQSGVSAREIASLCVTLSPYMNDTVGGAFTPNDDPSVAGLFSVKYAVACALIRGRMTLADIRPDAVLDPTVGALARRVEVHVNPNWPGHLAPAELEIRCRDGSTIHTRVDDVPGSRHDPLDERAFLAKVRDCYRHGPRPVDDSAVERLFETVMTLESLPDVRELISRLPN